MEKNNNGRLPFEMADKKDVFFFLASIQQTLLEGKSSEPEIQGTEYY